jgi:zinc protease
VSMLDTALFGRRRGLIGAALIAAALSLGAAPQAHATKIERVVSPGGIEAWLVRETAVPLIALDFTFRGGSDQDPIDKPGVANMATSLWDEGAGDLDSEAFHGRLEDRSIQLSFGAGRDRVSGSLRTLTENRDVAFEALRLALTAPRFDAPAVERIRAQLIAQQRRLSTTPNDIASRTFWRTAFPDHPYGRPVSGTPESIAAITTDDLSAYTRHVLAREHLKIAVVGDIDAASVGTMLDRVFGALPATPELKPVADVTMQGLGQRIVVPLDVPQAVVTFGTAGIARNDPDFMAAYIVNHILGGGAFSSRLYREVREKRGLAYGVSDSLTWLDHTAIMVGGTATRAAATGEALGIIEKEIHRLAEAGPTAEELADAKAFLEGSFALSLDTSGKIAALLVQFQNDKLGIDYIDRRTSLIEAVTLGDTKRVAKRLLDAGLLETIVGRPEGVTSSAISTERGG